MYKRTREESKGKERARSRDGKSDDVAGSIGYNPVKFLGVQSCGSSFDIHLTEDICWPFVFSAQTQVPSGEHFAKQASNHESRMGHSGEDADGSKEDRQAQSRSRDE